MKPWAFESLLAVPSLSLMCNAVEQGELSEHSSLIGYSYCLATATEVQSDSWPERSKEQQTLDHIIHTCVTGALGCVCVCVWFDVCASDWKGERWHSGFSWIMLGSWQGLGRRQASRPRGILCRTTLHKLLGWVPFMPHEQVGTSLWSRNHT